MCLFLEMLWVMKCLNLSGGKYFRHSEYFPCAKNLELPCLISQVEVAFVKILLSIDVQGIK